MLLVFVQNEDKTFFPLTLVLYFFPPLSHHSLCSFILLGHFFLLSNHSPQIYGQHDVWGPQRVHIQRKAEYHLWGSSLHLVPPAGPSWPANLDSLGTLAKREGSAGPGGLAKSSWVWRCRGLAPFFTFAHASGDTGGAPFCIYPWGGRRWDVPCRSTLFGPAHQ